MNDLKTEIGKYWALGLTTGEISFVLNISINRVLTLVPTLTGKEHIMDTEQEAIAELKAMTADRLALVDHDVVKWHCSALGCERFTRIKDYGISPVYYAFRRFLDLREFTFLCPKHWQYHKRVPEKLKYKTGPGIDHITPNK
jgi:hypothetical protein